MSAVTEACRVLNAENKSSESLIGERGELIYSTVAAV